MKQSRTALQTFFLTLLCIIVLQPSVASPLNGATTAVIEGVIDPYQNTSTPTKWLVAIAAAATTQRWYANQSAYSSSCHEIGRIRYELSQLAESKVQRALLSDAQIDDRREQLEEELATAEKQKLGAGRRRVLWGVPAAVLVYITCRNLYGWRAEIARIRKQADDDKKDEEMKKVKAERAKRAEEQDEIDKARKGNTNTPAAMTYH